jgi:hypothetical protein
MKSRSIDTGTANKATWGFQSIHEFLGSVGNRGSVTLPELTFLFELESRTAHIYLILISIHMNNH